MKRIILIFLLFANPTFFFAQSSIKELYLGWIKEDINRGNYSLAIEYLNKVLNLPDEEPYSRWTVMIYQESGLYYTKLDHAEGAIRAYNKALAILESLTDDWEAQRYQKAQYNIYSMLALNYKDKLMYEEAKSYYLKSVGLAKQLYGTHSTQYLYDNLNLASIYISEHNLILAQSILLPIISEIETLDENYDRILLSAYSTVAHMYDIALDYESEVLFRKKELELSRKIFGENSKEYAQALKTYALSNFSIYAYSESIKSLKKACEIEYRFNGHSKFYLDLKSYLATSYRLNGDKEKAIDTYQEILRLRNQTTDGQNIYRDVLNGLGLLYFDDFVKSEKYFLEAVKYYNPHDGEQLREYATIFNNLGLLYSQNGLYEEGEKYLLQAYNICQTPFDTIYGYGMGKSYYSILKNLSELYAKSNQLNKAYSFANEALYYCKTLNGENTTDYATALHTLGDIECLRRNYTQSEQLYKQALHLREKNTGKNSDQCALTYNALGVLYRFTGNYGDAIKAQKKALKIYSEHGSDLHVTYLNIADIEWLANDFPNCMVNLNSSLSYLKNYISAYFPALSDAQRIQYWKQFQVTIIDYGYNMVFDAWHNKINSEKIAYQISLLSKGILLDAEKQKLTYIDKSENALLKSKWEHLKSTREQIFAIQQSVNPNYSEITKLIKESEKIDKEIAHILPPYYRITDYSDIQKNIPLHAIAIEIINFPMMKKGSIVQNTGTNMYCALLLRNNSENPELIPLFEEKEMTALINTSTDNFINYTYGYENKGKEISEKVWGKILPYIKKGETIYFAPSGLLHQLAIESLPYDSTHTMADMFNLVRLSSTREIVLHKDNKRHEKAALYGGIQYNMSGKEFLTESQRYVGTDLLASRGIVDNTNNRGTVAYLKGTKEEVENINQMLKENQLQVQLFTSTTANEESFKALSGKHQNIVHIATHGFYWTDSTAQKSDYFSQRMMTFDQNMPTPPSIDPLNRCGLLFAGANTAYSGHSSELPEGVQDGILTAKEISLLDLRDADLVVLSACETGKGEITGEGVFGLQRAFKQAGAQTLVMSLWKVDDKATQLLMTEFYRNLISKHQSKREAFRNAQNHVRSQYKEPYYWAGFIMLD